MRKDYKVAPRGRKELKRIAEKWRSILPEARDSAFNVVAYVRALERVEILKTGKLNVVFFTASTENPPAFVTYNPTTLHVDFATWQEADEGEPSARFIIAHELGHIALHDHHAQPFSGVKQKWIQFEEESAEWQANVFAEYFLISDLEIQRFTCVFEMSNYCAIEKSVAMRRLHALYKGCGYCCPTCGANCVLQVGTRQNCFECGWAISV
jgi:predicted SprT family Zn-dependent metalloprotease